MKIATPSQQQSRDIIEKALPSRRPETDTVEISSHSADPTSKSRALADFCFGTAVDIVDGLIVKSTAKSSMDEATWSFLTAASPAAFPSLGGLIQSSGEGPTIAYPFLAPSASLSQYTNLADAGIGLAVGQAVSSAVTTIGKTLLSSHPHLVQAIDFVAGVIVVNLAKKEAHILYDHYTGRNPSPRSTTRGRPVGSFPP
jgi:hypothetical protein